MFGLGLVSTWSSAPLDVFTPASLLSGYSGDWWTATDLTKLFTDQAGTNAVTAAADTVGCWVGSVNGNRLVQTTDTTSLKPLYATGGYVKPDGVDDFLDCTTLSLTGALLTIAVVFDDTAVIGGASAVSVNASNAEYRYVSVTNGGNGYAQDRGGTTNSSTSPFKTNPGTSTKQSAFAIYTATGSSFFYTEADSGTNGATNTHSAAAKIIFGRYRDSGGYANPKVREMLFINKELTLADRNNLKTYWGAV